MLALKYVFFYKCCSTIIVICLLNSAARVSNFSWVRLTRTTLNPCLASLSWKKIVVSELVVWCTWWAINGVLARQKKKTLIQLCKKKCRMHCIQDIHTCNTSVCSLLGQFNETLTSVNYKCSYCFRGWKQ